VRPQPAICPAAGFASPWGPEMSRFTTFGNEMFYLNEKGEKEDTAIHEEILAQGDSEAMKKVGIAVARRIGLTDEEISALFNP
jgi:hypothetical protein